MLGEAEPHQTGLVLTAIDGQINGGSGVGKLRIKILDKNKGDAIVYDHQLKAPDSADPALFWGWQHSNSKVGLDAAAGQWCRIRFGTHIRLSEL